MEVKKILTIFVIAFCIASVFNMEIDCDFDTDKFYITATTIVGKYHCEINPDSMNLEDKDVLTVTGAHKHGKTNNDVEGVTFYHHMNTSYFATFAKLQEVFPSLEYLYIGRSNLTGISSQDLKHLPDLEYIDIFECKIPSIPSSLFQFNQKLKFIALSTSDDPFFVGKDIFKNLTNLQYVTFEENKCLNQRIYCEGRKEIDEFSAYNLSSPCFSFSHGREYSGSKNFLISILVLTILSKILMN